MSYKNVSNQTIRFLTELENNPFGTIISKLKDKFLDISTQHLFALARNCYINGYVTREKKGRIYSYKLTALGHSIAHSKKIPEIHIAPAKDRRVRLLRIFYSITVPRVGEIYC